MDQGPDLSDPRDAHHAWTRYRRILGYMNLVALGVAALTVVLIALLAGPIPWSFAALVFAGIYATIWLAAALMGLMFLSNGTGHDARIIDLTEGAHPLDD